MKDPIAAIFPGDVLIHDYISNGVYFIITVATLVDRSHNRFNPMRCWEMSALFVRSDHVEFLPSCSMSADYPLTWRKIWSPHEWPTAPDGGYHTQLDQASREGSSGH